MSTIQNSLQPSHPDKPDSITDSAEALLLQNLGVDFLAYVTASTPGVIHARLTSTAGQPLDDQQEAVLREVAAIVVTLVSSGEQPELLQRQLTEIFGSFDQGKGTTIVNVFRSAAGGELWSPKSADPIEQELLTQLRDVYPLLLLPEGSTPFSLPIRSLGGPLFRHPGRAALERAALDHPIIHQLFPNNNENTGPSGYAYSSAGRGGSIQLWMLADGLIRVGWDLARLSVATPAVEDHALGLQVALATIVSAVQGRPAAIPVRIGLTGVLLPDGLDELDLGWARVRAVDDRDANPAIDNSVPGSLQTSDESGQTVTIRYRGDLVVEMEIPYRIRLEEFKPGDGWPEGFTPNRIIDQRIENLRLGLLLSMELEPRALVLQSWVRILDPLLGHDSFAWREPQSMRNIHPRQLSRNDVDAWKMWATLIGERRQRAWMWQSDARFSPSPSVTAPRTCSLTQSSYGKTCLVPGKKRRHA